MQLDVRYEKSSLLEPKPAVAYAGEHFSKLKRGEVEGGCAIYAEAFRRNAGTW